MYAPHLGQERCLSKCWHWSPNVTSETSNSHSSHLGHFTKLVGETVSSCMALNQRALRSLSEELTYSPLREFGCCASL